MTAVDSGATSDPSDASESLDRYRAQLDVISQQQRDLRAKDHRFGIVRVVLFFLAVVFWVVGYSYDGLPGAIWLGWATIAVFLVVVVVNEPIRDKLQELKRHQNVVKRLMARLNRDWDQLATKSLTKQLAELPLEPQRREVAGDLDLLGGASLFHLVSMAATAPGIRTLATWLAGPADAHIAMARWEAVEALAPLRQQRLRLHLGA